MGDGAFWAKGRSIMVGKFMVYMETSEQPPDSCTKELGIWEEAARKSYKDGLGGTLK